MSRSPNFELPTTISTRTVLNLALPIMVSMLSYTFMSVVDTLFVGRLGTAPLAAIGLAITMVWLVYGFGNGLLAGARVVISQHMDAGNERVAREITWQALWLAGVMSVAVVSIGPFVGGLFGLLGASPEVSAQASLSVLNGAGDTRFTMWVSVGLAWLVLLPVGYALAVPAGLGAMGAWLGLTAEIVTVTVICLLRLRGKAWLEKGLKSQVAAK